MANAEHPVMLYIVDDDPHTREELGRILSKNTELVIRTFAAPSEALAGLTGESPDLLLLDLRLPEMDGLTLLERVQAKVPDVMAIIMTGYGEAATPRLARERGAVDFVEKPLDLPYLLVTLRQLAREAALRRNLKAAGELFLKVLDMMPDGILMADASGQVLFRNALGEALWASGAREPGTHYPHGGRLFVLQRNASGDRVLWHWLDLTHSLERERASSYRQMARLLAHEIRNPLTPMKLWLQELGSLEANDPKLAETSREAARILLQQVDRLTALVERFKTLGEERPLSLDPVDAQALVREVLRALGPLAVQVGVRLEPPAEGPLRLMGEESSLYQLLFNLVRNGIEASAGGGGVVAVTFTDMGEWARVEVADEGGGLPPEVEAAPFTPYLTTKEGGTGLGLLVCRELASRMGGRFELDNKPGRGVTARIELKRAP